jgi:myo-inositol 2-dehydrogenase/D-chiro-inositol 1-dehydrogenase
VQYTHPLCLQQAPAFQSLSEAIHHSNSNSPLDGVIISTPTPTHERLITEAANNNINIFTEKPVDETSAKIRKLFNAVRAQNVHLCCGFQRRFDDSYLSLYNTIHSGGIGTPLTASIFFGDHPVPSRQFLLQGGGNIISDCSAHDVDYIRWVLGDEVESVFAMGTSSDEELRDKNVIDNATMVMKFLKGEKCTGLSLENKDRY